MGVTTRDLLDHLIDRYGKITLADLKDNKLRINEPIDPSVSLKKYFKLIDDCVQFDYDGNTLYSPKQILQTTLLSILSTGIYG